MNIFGEHFEGGCDAPFEMDIKMEVKGVEFDQEEAKQIFIESVSKSIDNNRKPYLTEDEHTTYSNGVMNTVEVIVDSLVKNTII